MWQGHRHRAGYGMVVHQGRHWYVHRLVYVTAIGPVPDGLELDHLCRNRACANPDHLEVVTHDENMRRSVGNNSLKTHCPAGHAYTSENTHVSQGKRSCKTCGRERMRVRRAAGLVKPADPEAERERFRKWRDDNREHYRAYQREYQRNLRAQRKQAAG